MSTAIRKLIKCLYNGIACGCIFFVFFCVIQSVIGNEAFMDTIYHDYTKHALGTIVVGMGFGTTPFVYSLKNMSMFARTTIHFVVGMTVFFSVAFYLKWLPYPQKVTMLILEIFISTTFFFAVWSVFYVVNRKEAKRINERLRELEGK